MPGQARRGEETRWHINAEALIASLALMAGAWPRLRATARVLAVGLLLVGVALSLWIARGRDLRQLAAPQLWDSARIEGRAQSNTP
jgi:hypothetical protein